MRSRLPTRRLGVATMMLMGCLTLAGSLAAKQPSEVDKDAARAMVQRGDERRQVKDYAGALQAYRQADDIMGVPTTSIEVARMELKLGHLVEALASFKRAASHPKKAGEPPPFTRARAAAKKQARKLKKRIPRVTVDVRGVPPELTIEVQLDDKPQPSWYGVLRVNPGEHTIKASAAGYVTQSETFELQEGKEHTVSLTLEEEQPDTPDQPGPPSWHMPMAYGGFVVAGVALIAGSITGGLSLSDAAELEGNCNGDACPPDMEDTLGRSQTLAHVSTTGFVLAGVGAAIGTVGLVLSLSSGSSAAEPETEPETETETETEADISLQLNLDGSVSLRGHF